MRINLPGRNIFIAVLSLFVFLLAAAPAMAADVASFRNEEQVPAKMAVMGQDTAGGWIVAGWVELAPDVVFELPVDSINKDQLYVYVEFADSSVIQHMNEGHPVKEAWVVDGEFEHEDPDTQCEGTNPRKVTFIKVIPENGELWFNLTSVAG